MVKKYIYLLLVTVLVITGCSGGTGTQQPQEPTSSGTASQEVNNETQEPAAQEPTSFSIAYVLTSTTGYHTRVSDWENDPIIKELERLTNTDLEVSIIQEDKLSLMFASNDIPDVLVGLGTPTSSSMAGSVEAGVFMPLDELLEEHAPLLMERVPQAAWDAVSYQGQIYGVPTYLSNPSRRGTYLRMDLLEQTGLPVPKTIEEYLDVLRAFKELGVANPYQMRENFKYADTIFGAFDVLPYKDQFEVVNGQVQPKFFDVENMTKAIETYKTMYEEGLIPQDFATITSSDYSRNINGGNAGSWSSNASGLITSRNSIREVYPDAKVEIIPSPVGPEGKGGYFLYMPVINTTYINKNVEPERAAGIIKFIEWMQTEEGELFHTFGIEGVDYQITNGQVTLLGEDSPERGEGNNFRAGTVWLGRDGTYNPPRKRLELTEDGRELIQAFEDVLNQEGLSGIGFYPDLEAFVKYPDLAAPSADVGPKLIVDNIIMMIYGRKPVSDWPLVIEEYLEKGGREILEEANRRYQSGEGVIVIE